jgi:PhnB protein
MSYGTNSVGRSCTIAPWLSVSDARGAIHFYKSAFHANEVYHMEDPSGVIVSRLSVGGAEFWVSDDPESRNGNAIRMILTVDDPDSLFDQAIAAGGEEVYPVSDAHGWRVGRMVDPYGFHWEIGSPLSD